MHSLNYARNQPTPRHTPTKQATGQAVKGGLEVAGAGVKVLKQGYDAAAPYIKAAADAAAPVVKEATKAAADAAAPVVGRAAPLVSDTLAGAAKSSGVDVKAAADAARAAAKVAAEGAGAAQPFAQKLWVFLTTTPPAVLGEYALAGFALYLLAPVALGAAAGKVRGYAGDVGAVQALEAANREGAVIVDIRREVRGDEEGDEEGLCLLV